MKRHVRKLTRVGKRSLSIIIPSDIVEELNLKSKQRLSLRRSGTRIVIEDWKK